MMRFRLPFDAGRPREATRRNTAWTRVAAAPWSCLLAAVTLLAVQAAAANEIDGFTEPFRTIQVAAAETGTICAIDVHEGQAVHKDQVLARLDDDVFQALLAIADEARHTRSQLKSAEAELALRQHRLAQLTLLRQDGHARQVEVDRARTDVAIAEANVLAAQESLRVKHLEYAKIQVQLEKRVIRAPLDAVVTVLHKNVGEFVAPNDPHVLELVALNPLLATFSVPRYLIEQLQVGDTVRVYLDDASQIVSGKVEYIAPVTDAESGTVRVKVRVANDEGRYRSGERCTLQLPSASTSRPSTKK